MKKFEYRITKHPSAEFEQVGIFCTDQGECNVDQLPSDQLSVLEKILNEKGGLGWDLVQISFGKDGVIAFWKKEI